MTIETQEIPRKFHRYNHIERIGHIETEGLENGDVYVFPKLDGTNASIWWNGQIQAGSRNRTLSLEKDNAGFMAWVVSDDEKATALRAFCEQNPNYVVYGEWLVPHSLKTYRDEAWRRFWVFDVYNRETRRFLSYDEYSALLAAADVMPPKCIISNPTQDQMLAQLQGNTFMIKDGEGEGEGVVFKNYDWVSRFGNQVWGKLVRNEFKEQNHKEMGCPVKTGAFQVEIAIADEFVTDAFVEKTYAKVLLSVANEVGITPHEDDWQTRVAFTYRSRVIPMLLGISFYDFINEELYGAIKRFKNPTIDFKKLNQRIIVRIKEVLPELFA